MQWFDVFNSHNLPMLLSLYDNGAVHYSPKLKLRKPETKGMVTGKTALQKWWQDAFDRLPTLQYEVTALTADDSRVFMEYIRYVSGEEDLPVAEIVEIKKA